MIIQKGRARWKVEQNAALAISSTNTVYVKVLSRHKLSPAMRDASSSDVPSPPLSEWCSRIMYPRACGAEESSFTVPRR